ncbi:MAG: hypothetical protein ACRCUM_01390, partial [Mycoplasmoidaceae bacterium]
MELLNTIVRFVDIKTSAKNTEYVTFSATLPEGGGFLKCVSFVPWIVEIMKPHKDEDRYHIAGKFQNKQHPNLTEFNKTNPQIIVYGVERRPDFKNYVKPTMELQTAEGRVINTRPAILGETN